MKKLNVILHETTIINFPFFWKLLVRYKLFSIFIPLMVISYSTYFYNSQNNIYLRKKYFKNRATESDSPTSAIASVIGEKTSVLSESEIIGIVSSLDFQQEFTKEVYSHPDFNKLNFGALGSKENFNMTSFLDSCQDKEPCILNRLRSRIFGFVSIKPDQVVSNKFFIQVNTRDSYTTKFLLGLASKHMIKNRIETIKHKIDEQISISKELADQKRNEIETVNLKQLRETKVRLESEIGELNKKVGAYDQFHQKLKIELALVETQVDETKRASNSKVETDKLLLVQKRERLEDKVRKLEKDIGAIRSVSDTLSVQDREIISQLTGKLKRAKKDLLNMGDQGRKVSSVAHFIKEKEGESNYTEFNYRVLKEQYKKSKVDYEKLIAEREEKVKELGEVRTKLEAVKPSFEYLQLLEQKSLQLTLLNSTVVSDLVFENQLSPESVYKKTGKSKVILFTFVGSFLLLCLIIFSLYMFDDRIFDQSELEKSFEDLTIIGNTPDFD